MAPFYYYPHFMPGCEACFSCAGCGGCRIVKANGEATFVCQPCRDTIANIIFLVPDAAAATALVSNGFCQFCFSKPSAGICCDECAVKTPDELEFVARKGTILVLLANALQQPGAREQMLEPIMNAENGGMIPMVADAAVMGGGEQLHFDPALPAPEWQNMPLPDDVEFEFYPNEDFQFENQAEFPGAGMNLPKPEPLDDINAGGHPDMPIPNPPVTQFAPQIVVPAPAQSGEAKSSINTTSPPTARPSLAARVLGLAPERADSPHPQCAQQPSGHSKANEKILEN